MILLFFEQSGITFEIVNVFFFDQKNIKTKCQNRNYHAVALRLDSQAIIKTKDAQVELSSGALSFMPARLDYERISKKDKFLVVDFCSKDIDFGDIEYFYPENTEKYRVLFEKAHRIWSQKKTGYRYMAASVFNEILAEAHKDTTITELQKSGIYQSVKYIDDNMFKTDFNLFHSLPIKPLPFKYYFIPVLVGAVCGAAAILFSKAAIAVRRFGSKAKMPILAQVLLIFAGAFLLAIFFEDAAFSGHDLIETLFSAEPIWYALLILIAVRAAMLIFSNSIGVTGGLFVPLLTLGALLGAVCLAFFNLAGGQVGEYSVYFILTGLAAFIASANKMPLTVTLFTAEIICGFKNILPVALAVSVSYLIFYLARQKDLTEVICEELYEKNKNPERN